MIRYVITHISDAYSVRRLTFAQQARYTYATPHEASFVLAVFREPQGLPRVLSTREVSTLAVRPVDCYEQPGSSEPGDPKCYYFTDHWTVEAGRNLHYQGHPVVAVKSIGEHAKADAMTRAIAELLNAAGVNPESVFRDYMDTV